MSPPKHVSNPIYKFHPHLFHDCYAGQAGQQERTREISFDSSWHTVPPLPSLHSSGNGRTAPTIPSLANGRSVPSIPEFDGDRTHDPLLGNPLLAPTGLGNVAVPYPLSLSNPLTLPPSTLGSGATPPRNSSAVTILDEAAYVTLLHGLVA